MDKQNSIFKEMDPIYLSTDTIPKKESTAFSTPPPLPGGEKEDPEKVLESSSLPDMVEQLPHAKHWAITTVNAHNPMKQINHNLIPFLQTKKLRHRMVKCLTQGGTASKW